MSALVDEMEDFRSPPPEGDPFHEIANLSFPEESEDTEHAWTKDEEVRRFVEVIEEQEDWPSPDFEMDECAKENDAPFETEMQEDEHEAGPITETEEACQHLFRQLVERSMPTEPEQEVDNWESAVAAFCAGTEKSSSFLV
ncbi:MAG: hypothetical protein MHM6MM_008890 [Cercozoa sp. M6MM]